MICLKPPFLANNMEDLFSKVCKGKYPNIPSIFSPELKKVLALLMQVKPRKRPTSWEILNLKEVKDKIDELYLDEENQEQA